MQIDSSFFDPENGQTHDLRVKLAEDTLQDMIEWFHQGGQVGIYDASNTCPNRRKEIMEVLARHSVSVVFIENICTDPSLVASNIMSVKISSPDYAGWDPQAAVKDFETRINYHLETYKTIDETDLSFVKLIDVGEQIIVNNIQGYLQTRIVFYLMNLHITPRTIYFVKNGQSMNDNSYKTDAPLSPNGFAYALALTKFMQTHRENRRTSERTHRPLTVWTSCRRRSFMTASYFEDPIIVRQKVQLAEINPGTCDMCSEDEIKAKFPQEYVAHQKDPYRHRYPRAESYHDLALRLESIILELERERNDVLIIAHETVLKTLYAYLFDRQEKEIPQIEIPSDTIIEIIPSAYACKEVRHEIPRLPPSMEELAGWVSPIE